MSAAHTPGPWDLDVGDKDTSSEVFVLRLDLQVLIADVHSHVFGAGHADAYLIAAAPDLLEALRGVVRVADRATAEFDAAHAAIAKATGAAA